MTPLQKRFAEEYVVDFNKTQAYLRATGDTVTNESARVLGSKTFAIIAVQVYVNELLDAREAQSEINAKAVLRQLWKIATADPSKMSQHRIVCCRHCHHPEHKFQWRSVEEWALAVSNALAAHEEATRDAERRELTRMPVLTLPSNDGGFGFDPHLDIDPTCTHCDAKGETEIWFADTRTLRGPEKALFAGVKKTRDGLEIKTRDQDKAIEMIGRHLGMWNDKLILGGGIGVGVYSVDDLKALSTQELEVLEQAAMKIEDARLIAINETKRLEG